MPASDGLKLGHIQRHVLRLLEDGPNVLREMERDHGTEDTRRALRSLERRGIVTAERTPGQATIWSIKENA